MLQSQCGVKVQGSLMAAAVTATLLLALSTGCVERRLTIRSNPPGALVYVDDTEIGVTPATASFTYYGRRKIRLVKDGYETLTVLQSIPPPWYDVIGADFVSENLVPGQIHDRRTLDYTLRPLTVVPGNELLSRAEQLRRGVQGGATGTLPAPTLRVNPPPPSGPGFSPTPAPLPAPSSAPPTAPAFTPTGVPAMQGIGGQAVHPLP
ncbi:MAG: PEGA domain-containing protein [Thermoguttaceae bacterium]|jgi:hypothetical protein